MLLSVCGCRMYHFVLTCACFDFSAACNGERFLYGSIVGYMVCLGAFLYWNVFAEVAHCSDVEVTAQ